jgi:hypothetical protein
MGGDGRVYNVVWLLKQRFAKNGKGAWFPHDTIGMYSVQEKVGLLFNLCEYFFDIELAVDIARFIESDPDAVVRILLEGMVDDFCVAVHADRTRQRRSIVLVF